MFTPRRSLASLLIAGALATGVAACGGDSDSDKAQQRAAELQDQGDQLRQDAEKASQEVQDGTKSAEDAAAEIQAGAEDLADDATDAAAETIDDVKDNTNVPDAAKEQLEQAQEQLETTTP